MQFKGNGKNSVNGRIQEGIKRILQERGLCPERGITLDEARELLRAQPDFVSQKMWLEETVESLGSSMILYPKFHPEFNWIEMYGDRSQKVLP